MQYEVFLRAFIPSSTTNLRQGEHDTPHLALVAETIFANNFQLRITNVGLVGVLRHEQRQAHAQWPESTDRRADSNATKN